MSAIDPSALSSESPAVSQMRRVLARPRIVALYCVAVLAGSGWAALGLMAGLDQNLIDQLCRPLQASADAVPLTVLFFFAMWSAMALAMMVPSAAPMLVTYAEIAETAAGKDMPVVSPFILALGYVAVWIGFAAGATALQMLFTQLSGAANAATWLTVALFSLAGAYQFSNLKHACLRACQRPFPFFFRNWRTTPAGVFRLGLQQGLHCLGCCWALMSLMLIAGAMNVIWMAALGAVMTVEKTVHHPLVSRIIGIVLLGIGAVLAISHLRIWE